LRIADHWKEIQRVVQHGQASSLYCSIASASPDGIPNITPIGTVFLRDNGTGFYFDQYTSLLSQNLETNPNVCLMAVNASAKFWFLSLFGGRFRSPPGVRLYGTAGALRPATEEELQRVRRRVGLARRLKGGRMLWSNFSHVRDVQFTSFRPVQYPVMMDGMWTQREIK
jgi:hypothetical protein